MTRLLILLAAIGLSSSVLLAQDGPLTPEQIETALQQGRKQAINKTGLQMPLLTRGWRIARFMILDDPSQEQWRLTLFSPMTWVQRCAAQAASEYRTFKAPDLTENDLAPVLRVFINDGNAKQIVLRDEQNSQIVQPLKRVEHALQTVMVAFDNEFLTGEFIEFQFDLTQVRTLRMATKDHVVLTVVMMSRTAQTVFSEETKAGRANQSEISVVLKAEHFKKLP